MKSGYTLIYAEVRFALRKFNPSLKEIVDYSAT